MGTSGFLSKNSLGQTWSQKHGLSVLTESFDGGFSQSHAGTLTAQESCLEGKTNG